jgi:hypothetical protein
MDGKPNPAYSAALTAYRQAVGASTDGEPDFAVWQAFLLRAIPAPPQKPFVAERAADAKADAASASPTAANEIRLSVLVSKTRYRKGDPVELTLSTSQPAYVYCYVQSPASGKIQRIFPNRFARDPRVEANTPLVLPGAQGFKVAAGGDGVKQQVVGCLATEREIYNDLPPPLRWSDFEDIKLGTFEEIRDAFAQVAKAPVALEGAIIDVSDQ